MGVSIRVRVRLNCLHRGKQGVRVNLMEGSITVEGGLHQMQVMPFLDSQLAMVGLWSGRAPNSADLAHARKVMLECKGIRNRV